MRLNKIYIILSFLLLSAAACTDLKPEVDSDILVEEYYKTPAQFSSLVANAYSQLAGEHGYVYREGYWSLQEYTSDEVVVPTRKTDWYDGGIPISLHEHSWNPDTRDVSNGWSFAYGGVGNCNTTLDQIQKIKGTDSLKYDDATLKGIAETKVLRAFYHLLAMDLYGRIAISESLSKAPKQAESREAVFNWIEKEILENIGKLKSELSYGSLTKSVAHTMLAKLYLNAEVYTGKARWQDAVDQCDSVIKGGYGYLLNPDYFTAFKKENTGNKEIIFPVVFDATRAKGNMFHLMSLHYVHQEAYDFKTQPWNGPCTLKSFYDKYSANDTRKKQWFVGPITKDGKILKYTIENQDEVDAVIDPTVSTISDPTGANSFEGARFIKFEIEPGIDHHANSDFPIYRYADVLLMKAEALMRLNAGVANADALEAANLVHSRAGLPLYTTADLTLDEILNERGRELAWEGHRRQDLIRFGKFTLGEWEFKGKTSKNRIVFPIPQWVMDANAGVYKQNDWE